MILLTMNGNAFHLMAVRHSFPLYIGKRNRVEKIFGALQRLALALQDTEAKFPAEDISYECNQKIGEIKKAALLEAQSLSITDLKRTIVTLVPHFAKRGI